MLFERLSFFLGALLLMTGCDLGAAQRSCCGCSVESEPWQPLKQITFPDQPPSGAGALPPAGICWYCCPLLGLLPSAGVCWYCCHRPLHTSMKGEQAQRAAGSGFYEAPAGCRGGQAEEVHSWVDRGTLQTPRPPSPDASAPSWTAVVLSSLYRRLMSS